MSVSLGMEMRVETFRHVGTVACIRNILNSLVKISTSWSAHALSTAPEMPSGPAAFLMFPHLVLLEREGKGDGVLGRQYVQVCGGLEASEEVV